MIVSNVKPGAPPMCDVSWNGKLYSNVTMVMGPSGWHVSLRDLLRKL